MKILLAVDQSKFSEAAMKMILQQMRPEGVEVCVLHVVHPVVLSPDYGGMEPVEREEHRRHERGEKLISACKTIFVDQGFAAITALVEGDPRVGILDYAAEWKADLIVVGSHGLTGLERLLSGSVAESVARHAHCSVLMVRIPHPQSH